ncbi:MAG: taurine--2-oxoglutarate transaminase [Limisphaerales bacterium]|jgi:taurine--2-oxoglutarate transaminase
MTIRTLGGAVLEQNLEHTFFSWSKQGALNPVQIDRAEGVYLFTPQGKRLLDFSSQLMNVNIGHGQKTVTEAVANQMQKVSFVSPGFSTEVRGRLGEKLAEISPGDLNKTLFTLSGAEAIENAIKLARLYTGRHKIITQYRSYHGATYGAISASGDPRKLKVDSQQVPNIVRVENPYTYRCPWYSASEKECGQRALENLHNVIKYEGPENVAAIIMEGESGSSGCIKYPPMYLKAVKALCEKYGVLFIADEVMSGFCRTGKWFGVDNHEVTPDILCFAKGVTSGYIPLGGMIVRKAIAEHYDNEVLPLGLTYSAHPVACAAALAVIDIYEKEELADRAVEIGAYLDKSVAKLMEKHVSIGDWRNTGMLGCLEIVKNRETKEPMAPWNAKPSEMTVMSKVSAKLGELGMFTFVKWNFIFVVPPLISTKENIDEGMSILNDALVIADEACH